MRTTDKNKHNKCNPVFDLVDVCPNHSSLHVVSNKTDGSIESDIRHCGLVVSAPAWDGTGCELDSWQCRIYIPCSLSLRLLGSLRGSLGTYGLTQKLCLKKSREIYIADTMHICFEGPSNRPGHRSEFQHSIQSDRTVRRRWDFLHKRTHRRSLPHSELDRDQSRGRPVWNFNVLAHDEPDMFQPSLTGYAEVRVMPKDINDNAPVFDRNRLVGKIPEHSRAGMYKFEYSS